MNDTQTQIERLIELAIVQRTELKQLVEQLPQLREHLNAEIERTIDEVEPQLRAELEDWTTKQTTDQTAKLGASLEAKITELAKALEVSTQARYSAILAEREKNFALAAEAEAKIAEHAASLPEAVKGIVDAELARFPRAGEIDQLRKEFAEPKSLNPRGKWQAGVAYNKLDLVTINGDSYTSATDNNRTRPSRSSADWTLVAARGTGGGGGPTSLSELTTVPSNGDLLIGSGTSWVTSNLTAGAGISITVGAGEITISATDGDITLDDGTAASPSLHFTNDPDTGIYRPAANTLGISVSGTQVAYFDENGLTIPNAGVVAGGSFHAANGNANNPSHSFTSDQDTGFYRHATNQIGVSTSGVASLIFTENAGELLGHTGVSVTFGAGSSGATIALGQGTNGAVTITPKGSGGTTLATGLLVNSTTDSSSKDTGAIITEGGLGVEKSATIGGNLTVSGTGTSSVAGLFDANAGLRAVSAPSYAASTGKGVEMLYISVSDIGYVQSYDRTASAYKLLNVEGSTLRLNSGSGGNVLIGTTTDSANGKLQLATHTTSAGGIGFGTDTALYRAAQSIVAIDGLSTSYAKLRFYESSSLKVQLESVSGDFTLATLTAGKSIKFNSGNDTLALTLDSSQHATFAGVVQITNAGSNSSILQDRAWLWTADGLRNGTIRSGVYGTSTGSLVLGTGASLTTALTLDSSQNATFAGTVSIGNVGTNSHLTLTRSANTGNGHIKFITGTTDDWILGERNLTDSDFHLYNYGTSADALKIERANSNATFAGAIAIGNTVNTVSPTSPNRTITMVIGGTTYYIHAKTTND